MSFISSILSSNSLFNAEVLEIWLKTVFLGEWSAWMSDTGFLKGNPVFHGWKSPWSS